MERKRCSASIGDPLCLPPGSSFTWLLKLPEAVFIPFDGSRFRVSIACLHGALTENLVARSIVRAQLPASVNGMGDRRDNNGCNIAPTNGCNVAHTNGFPHEVNRIICRI